MSLKQLQDELVALERELREAEANLPRHSIQAMHIIRIEDLQDSIRKKKAEIDQFMEDQG